MAKRVAPLEVEYSRGSQSSRHVQYEFEPDADELLGALLPKYINDADLRGAAGVGGVRVGVAAAGR